MYGTEKNELNNSHSDKLTRYSNKLKFSTIATLAIVLSACGGGGGGDSSSSGGNNGGGSGGSGGGSQSQRIAEAVMDFDNNGQIDARFDYVYFSDGRINIQTYTYIGDGTPDIYNPYYSGINVTRADVEFGYDANGNLETLRLTFDNGTVNDTIYTYNGNQFIQSDTNVTVPGGTAMLTGLMSYVNGLPDQFDLSSNGTPAVNYSFSYNPSNQVIQSVRTFAGSTNPETSTYTWNPDGSLDSITNVDNFSTDTEELTYSNGLLFRRDFTFSKPPTNSTNTNVAWLFYYNNGVPTRSEFDLNMDGVIDGNLTVTMEDGPCTPVYFNIPEDITQIGLDGIPGSQNGVTWCS